MPQPCLEGAAEETIWHLSTKTRRVWNAYAQPDTTYPQSGRSDSEATLKILTLAELDKSYPATAWTQVFTDGSAENATRNGGCCIYIRQPNKPLITLAIPGGDLCSIYRAEAQALLTATETVTQLETIPKKVVLLIDSLSVLQSLASGNPEVWRQHLTKKLIQSINSLKSRTTAILL